MKENKEKKNQKTANNDETTNNLFRIFQSADEIVSNVLQSDLLCLCGESIYSIFNILTDMFDV